jgi:hypothetical protein
MAYDEYTPRAFICGTQKDLSGERELVSRLCVLRDVLPQGMELFSASDQTQWDFIKRILKKCDFVIVLLGGRYGSINASDEAKRSYSECEYSFAVDEKIPVLLFVKEMSDGQLLDANSDANDPAEAARKMKAFRASVMEKRLSVRWSNREELISKLGVAIDKHKRESEKRFIENRTSLISKLELDHYREELQSLMANSQQVTVRSTSNDFDHAEHIHQFDVGSDRHE